MAKVESGVDVDVAYGETPESALMSILAKQPAFDTKDAEYVGERPGFMDVKAGMYFNDHDWEQYARGEPSHKEVKGGSPHIHERIVYDKPMTEDQRIQIRLTNIWAEVNRGDGRVEVKFQFSVQLRESELKGEMDLRDRDHHWRCERMSTEPI